MKQIKLIGVGGIGTSLLSGLCQYLNFDDSVIDRYRVTLIDGDSFEEGNKSRQLFKEFGNKAKSKAEELAKEYGKLSFRAIAEFVKKDSIASMIEEGDIVLLSVDNHQTRNLVSEHCQTLSDIALISAGNELTDGNAQVYIRKEGKDITAPLTRFHPEIANPADRNPGEMSCAERAKMPSSRQIIITNMCAAWLMFRAFWLVEQGKTDKIGGESYFDVVEGKVQTMERRAQ